jgi:hypothetical protein
MLPPPPLGQPWPIAAFLTPEQRARAATWRGSSRRPILVDQTDNGRRTVRYTRTNDDGADPLSYAVGLAELGTLGAILDRLGVPRAREAAAMQAIGQWQAWWDWHDGVTDYDGLAALGAEVPELAPPPLKRPCVVCKEREQLSKERCHRCYQFRSIRGYDRDPADLQGHTNGGRWGKRS